MVAHISFLPVEILQYIFILAQARDCIFFEYPQIIQNARVAAALSYTCQHWRAVALGMSELWTFLSDEQYNSWDLYMKRSHPRPLVFGLADPTLEYPLPESTERVQQIVLKVFSEGERIFDLLNSCSFLSLCTISMSGDPMSIPVPRAPDTQAIIPYPNRFLALKNLHCKNINFPVIPMFPSLVNISVDAMVMPVESALAPSASTLTHITFGASVRSWFGARERVTLPVLKSLTLNNTPVAVAIWLITPALKVLRLQKYVEQENLIAIKFAIAVWRNDPLALLTEFTLHIEATDSDDGERSFLWHMFVAFPNVRKVRWDVPNKLVSQLGSRLNDNVWTGLEDIALRVQGEDANEELLATMRKTNARELVKPYLHLYKE
ncbi:hypothetical protein CYLTODRAFT_491514 [Cylindrobasidium torrendii FP15055 ss-10]|uniref:Uncharacterized protein n=1 Tax=Cylindrobasidium torrendii FP15055 ss-10 TaxID=1314674 RepID=A0A0D7BA41_9AGAR|nr:hypothetical protein CYLTODRAFT_491514 [Cylindrobasidium torrendii FP15055 ss-10]